MNAMHELNTFLSKLPGHRLSSAHIVTHAGKDLVHIVLYGGYTEDELDAFHRALDFEYDDGYGSQELFGFLWFADGTWAERGEYDGAEWWRHVKPPSPPIRGETIFTGENPYA